MFTTHDPIPMNLFDSHCHLDKLDLAPFGESFDVFMAAAFTAGVRRMLCVAIHPERWQAMAELVSPYVIASGNRPQVWLSFGIHPTEAPEYALDAEAKELGLDEQATYAKLRFLVRGHLLASGTLTGTFAVG